MAPNIRNRNYTIAAELEIATAEAGGVIFSQGSRFGGHALYVKDGKLAYVYNWLGEHVPDGRLRGEDPHRARRGLGDLRAGGGGDADQGTLTSHPRPGGRPPGRGCGA